MHAPVRVDSNYERITERSSLLQAPNMTQMQQIETAIGKHNAPPVAFPWPKPQNRFLKCQNLWMQRNSMKAYAKIASAFKKALVYHAQQAQRFRGARFS